MRKNVQIARNIQFNQSKEASNDLLLSDLNPGDLFISIIFNFFVTYSCLISVFPIKYLFLSKKFSGKHITRHNEMIYDITQVISYFHFLINNFLYFHV